MASGQFSANITVWLVKMRESEQYILNRETAFQ